MRETCIQHSEFSTKAVLSFNRVLQSSDSSHKFSTAVARRRSFQNTMVQRLLLSAFPLLRWRSDHTTTNCVKWFAAMNDQLMTSLMLCVNRKQTILPDGMIIIVSTSIQLRYTAERRVGRACIHWLKHRFSPALRYLNPLRSEFFNYQRITMKFFYRQISVIRISRLSEHIPTNIIGKT